MEIVDSVTALSASIENTLFHRFESSTEVYLLLEMQAEHPLTDLIRACPPERVRHLAHSDFENCPTQAPLLIRLESRHDPLLAASVELAVMQASDLEVPIRQISGWLFSDLSFEKMAVRLTQRLTLVHGHGRVRVRLQDPRVLVQLPHLLNPLQAEQFFSIGDWYCVNDGAELQHMDLPKPEQVFQYMMLITQPQLASLKRIGIANSAMDMLRLMGHRYDLQWIPLMHAQILNAIAYGFNDSKDLTAYATHGVAVHPRFDQHPLIAQAISSSRLSGRSFVEAVRGIDEETLRAIALELERDQPTGQQGVPHD